MAVAVAASSFVAVPDMEFYIWMYLLMFVF